MSGLRQSREPLDAEASKRERLMRFVGPLEAADTETIDHWRHATPEQHAKAMSELSDYAQQMAQQTGLGKTDSDVFPGFPPSRQEAGPKTAA